ncbi:hypothetical protein KJ975_08465 [Myxococcota bacterium]|nr:hypothetical protein [Myxococcota bacterium]
MRPGEFNPIRRIPWLPFLLVAAIFSPAAKAAEGDPRYAGGMMIMGGRIAMQDEHAEIRGVTFGVGGRLVFMVGHGFRIGLLGGTGKMSYGELESHFQYTHGALSAEWGMTWSRITMTAGITGGLANYYILDKHSVSPDGVITAREHENSVPILSPFLSVEFALSGRLRATIFVDYANMRVEGHPHGGIRIGAGVLFVK